MDCFPSVAPLNCKRCHVGETVVGYHMDEAWVLLLDCLILVSKVNHEPVSNEAVGNQRFVTATSLSNNNETV